MKGIPFLALLVITTGTATYTQHAQRVDQCDRWLAQFPQWNELSDRSQSESFEYCQAQIGEDIELSPSAKKAIAFYVHSIPR
ncbi:MAG: hypothetical protein AAFX40_19175 [Cyanobacteria bacterium J06639_1]